MIDSFLNGAVIGLATWRLSYALTQEGVFKWLRDLFRVELSTHEVVRFGVKQTEMFNTSGNLIGKLLSCIYCTSFWVGVGFWGLYKLSPDIVWIFAIAGIASLIQDWRSK